VKSSKLKKYLDGEELRSALEKTAETFRKRFQREAEPHQVLESPIFRFSKFSHLIFVASSKFLLLSCQQ